MKNVLLLSAAALLALGCAAASSIRGTAVALHDGEAAVVTPAQAAIHGAALSEPADAPIRVASADRGARDGTIGAARAYGAEGRATSRTASRGSAPAEAYGGAARNPEATACGGVDNNPAGEASLFIPKLTPATGGSSEEDEAGAPSRPNGKMKDALTPASKVEGNNPTEDGSLFVPSAGTQGRKGERAGARRAAGRVPEALSPMTARSNNNPMDDSSALRLPEAVDFSRRADRFGRDGAVRTHAVGERARIPGRVPDRRDARSDNNPLD